MACVFWDGVGPSVNCVWPLVSGGLSPLQHTHTHTPLVGYTLLPAWCDDLLLRERPLWLGGELPIISCDSRWRKWRVKKYNGNSHCISFWFTSQPAMNPLHHILARLCCVRNIIFFCSQTRKLLIFPTTTRFIIKKLTWKNMWMSVTAVYFLIFHVWTVLRIMR